MKKYEKENQQMSELERIEALEREIRDLKGLNSDGIPTYSFSKIRDKELKEFLSIKKAMSYDIFDSCRILTLRK